MNSSIHIWIWTNPLLKTGVSVKIQEYNGNVDHDETARYSSRSTLFARACLDCTAEKLSLKHFVYTIPGFHENI